MSDFEKEVSHALGKIEGLVVGINEKIEATTNQSKQNAEDIGKLKTRMAWYAGAASALGFVAAKASSWLKLL